MKPARARQPKQQRQWNSKEVVYKGISFDSLSERDYYLMLERNKEVQEIVCHPSYQVMPGYEVECRRCHGHKRVLNKKTLNLNQCSLCEGAGKKFKQGIVYTPDFKVTYKDGRVEYVDVKGGGPVSKDFPLRRKLFERMMGVELVVVEFKRKEWVRRR